MFDERPTVANTEPTQTLVEAAEAYTPLSQMYDLDQNDPRGILTVREHNPMYLLPAWYNSSPNRYPESPSRGVADDAVSTEQKRLEAKMQVSFKTKLMEDLLKPVPICGLATRKPRIGNCGARVRNRRRFAITITCPKCLSPSR